MMATSSSSSSLDALAHLTGIGAQDAKAIAEEMQAFLAQQGQKYQQQQQQPPQQIQNDQQQVVDPLPGFVVKTAATTISTDDADKDTEKTPPNSNAQRSTKLFINVCHSPHVPPPPPVSEEEYEKALNGDETSQYRVPMGLSECKNDKDRAGEECIVFDVLVNSNVFSKIQSDPIYQAFCIEIAMELIELRQANIRIRRDYALPKLTVKGKLSKQTVQRQKRPMIADMSNQKSKQSESQKQKSKPSGISEIISSSAATGKAAAAASDLLKKATTVLHPNVTIVSEPENAPEFFVVTVELPQVRTTKNAELTLELPDKLNLIAPVSDTTVYKLQTQLPGPVSECDGAQFDRKTRKLSIVLTAGSTWKEK